MGTRLTPGFGPGAEAGRTQAPRWPAHRPRSPGQAREQPLLAWAPSHRPCLWGVLELLVVGASRPAGLVPRIDLLLPVWARCVLSMNCRCLGSVCMRVCIPAVHALRLCV